MGVDDSRHKKSLPQLLCKSSAHMGDPYIEFKSEKIIAMVLAEEIVAFANSEGGEL